MKKHKQIFRIYIDGKIGDAEIKGAWTAAPTAKVLKNEIPDIVEAVRMDNWDEVVVKVNGQSYLENHFYAGRFRFF
ncbi:MAG: hypothetical protein HC906_07460 [Bacteroidales bacterium]|nr:hypothetical protein [Bacteroidales bacterium]